MGKGLPENAYTPLKEGEKYIPVMPGDNVPEVTGRSVLWGAIMAALFTFAAGYLGLKVGQVFEAAIPIAILAVGISALYRRKSTLLENVIIQSIGAASGVIVAGAIFTTPAIFILQLQNQFPSSISLLFAIAVSAFLGGALGIFFLIPLRRYFVAEMHGKLPFPEATATTEILVAGEKGGSGALVLVWSMLIGGIYDFIAGTVKLWDEFIDFQWIPFMKTLNEKARMVLKLDAVASLLGLGYIVGLRYSAVIVAGSFLSTFVMIPLIWMVGRHVGVPIPPGEIPISSMNEVMLFKTYVQKIGIGAIATAGFIGILKSLPIMYKSFSLGFKEIFRKHTETDNRPRYDTDLKMSTIIIGIITVLIFMWIFFASLSNAKIATIGVIIAFLLAFLFTTVAATAIAIVGTNPVSGMTLVTLIITSLVLVYAGLSGGRGMVIALLIGSVVCTALSVAGGFITDLKIGYWTGATPRNQERYKFLGLAIASILIGIVIMILNQSYGFTSRELQAPQANLMAALISSMMSKQPVPWLLYGIGAIVAVLVEMSKVPTLAFALGMYLPLELNLPLLVGGFISYLVGKGKGEIAKKRRDKGTLIASGFIAGGALMGVVGAFLKFLNVSEKIDYSAWKGRALALKMGLPLEKASELADKWLNSQGEIISVIAFSLLLIFFYVYARRVKE
ncbi:MAG: oligopeptide transporter, OPT family [Candidatus Aminicenantes bacterium]|nr:oligopeptide transporter, OPT family [Candidatus Aminicenantes bacterium]